MSDMQLRANFASLDQGAADIDNYRGASENFKADAWATFDKMVGNLGDGIGTDTVGQIKKRFGEYLEEHIESINAQRTGLGKATDTMHSGATRMKSMLGNNA